MTLAPPSAAARTWSPRRAKSAERIEAASSIKGGLSEPELRIGRSVFRNNACGNSNTRKPTPSVEFSVARAPPPAKGRRRYDSRRGKCELRREFRQSSHATLFRRVLADPTRAGSLQPNRRIL